jgi:hypothetical protein
VSSRAVTERSIRLVEAKASALVSIMARRAGAESARLPGIEISRGTAYAGSLTSRCLNSITDWPGTAPGGWGDRPGTSTSPEEAGRAG